MTINIKISQLRTISEAEKCAELRASSEPWIKLKRDYQAGYQSITSSDNEVYIAYLENKLVGFVMVTLKGAISGFILSICVDRKFRNQKIGSQLLDFAERRIFLESPNVFLFVSSFNTSAQRLYLRNGYKKIGPLEDYIIDGYDEILMRKTIGSKRNYFMNKKKQQGD